MLHSNSMHENDDDVRINSVASKLPSHFQAWVRTEDEQKISVVFVQVSALVQSQHRD